MTHVAHADVQGDEIARGTVVRIEAKEIYVSLGRDRGVSDGAALRIKRPISLRHPITHATVADWVPIGAAKVTQAGAAMSRAVVGELVAEVRVGDIAEVLIDRPEPKVTAIHNPAAPPVDPATAEVLGLFAAESGQPIDARIAAWEHYLSSRTGSPYASEVRHELEELQALRDQIAPRHGSAEGDLTASVKHSSLVTVRAGTQIPVVFVLDQPERVASAYLHYRTLGERTYRSMLLVREHDLYLRGAVPAAAVRAPGVEYFVEVSGADGSSGLALASPSAPIVVDVSTAPLVDQFGSAPGHSSVKLAGDYLDFNNLDRRAGDRTDRMFTANVDFAYRLDSIVESIGVGYGVYAGAGGNANAVWTPMNPMPESGFQYGYADMELGHYTDRVHLAFGGKLIAGVGKAGFGLGAEARFRIGDRDGTNLLWTTRTIDQVGYLSDIRLGTRPLSRVLLGLSVGATNQPNREDVGVKLGTELELLAAGNVSLLVRGSWQGRSIDHGGVGGGAGLGFYW
jgi:hypothetical protein